MAWQLLITISVVVSSVSAVLRRKMLKADKSDPVAYAVFFQLCIAGLFLSYGLFVKDIDFSGVRPLALILFVVTLLYALGNIGIFTSLKYIEASKFTVIFSSRALFSAIGFSLLLGEVLSLYQYIGIFLLIGAVLVVNLGDIGLKFQKGDLYALVAGMSFGMANIGDRVLVQSLPLYTYLFLAFFIPPVLILILKPKTVQGFKAVLTKETLRVMILTIATFMLGAVTFYVALKQVDSPAKVTSSNLASIVLTVVLGIIFLGERKNIILKLLGTGLAVIGLYLVV